VIGGIAHERPAVAIRLSKEIWQHRTQKACFAFGAAQTLGESRHKLESLEIIALDVLFVVFKLGYRPSDDDLALWRHVTRDAADRFHAAALAMRHAMQGLNAQRGREELLLKIGIHEGPCLAVTLNERQDYFGQTVNIASRVQNLANSQSIFATGQVVGHDAVSKMLETSGIIPVARDHTLRGITNQVTVYEIP